MAVGLLHLFFQNSILHCAIQNEDVARMNDLCCPYDLLIVQLVLDHQLVQCDLSCEHRLLYIIEYLAFLGLICCLVIYNTNTVFLSIIIAFVALEIMMEAFQVQLKQKIAHIYNAILLLSALITNIISNGFYLSTVFPVFFMAILLFIARYIHVPNNKKHEQEA